MNRWPLIVANRCMVLALVACTQTVGSAQGQSGELDAQLAAVSRKHDVPALSVAVVNKDGVQTQACTGIRKRNTDDEVDLSDRFPIGSNTKSMTAALAAVLVESGKIDWTTTIGDVWPHASDKDIHPKLRTVTLDQLLAHQSGLAANISDLSARDWASFFAEKEHPTLERRRMLKVVLSQAPKQPQGQFAYSNLGYAVVSAMLETRAKQPFESLMKQHVFEPLGMRSADFRTLESAKKLQPPLLWGHSANGTPVDPRTAGAENPTVYAAAGTVHLSIEDYAKYARWQLAGQPSPVLQSQDTVDHLHQAQTDYTIPGAKYGGGWIMIDTPYGPALNHAGSNTNTFALIWVLLEANFAAVVCTNTGEPQAFPACDEMVSLLMREYASPSK